MGITVSITDPHTIPRQEMIAITDYLLLVAQPRVESKPCCRAEPLLTITEPEVPQCKTEPQIAGTTALGYGVEPTVPEILNTVEPTTLFVNEPAAIGSSVPTSVEPTTQTSSPAPSYVPPLPDLDSRGLPWDARIHSSSKNRNADGSWRKLRGVHEGFVNDVENELSMTMNAPAVPVAPIEEPVTQTPSETVIPDVPVVPVDEPVSFNDFMQYLTPKLAAGEINPAQVAGVIASVELPHIGALFNRPDLIPAVKQKIEALL